MTTNYTLPDGRDISQVFESGDAGLSTGYATSSGVDLGRQFMGGASGVVTGYKNPAGIDIGSLFGASLEAQGYAKATMRVGHWGSDSNPSGQKYGYDAGSFGSISDTTLLGSEGSLYAWYFWGELVLLCSSNGTKGAGVIINGIKADTTNGFAMVSQSEIDTIWSYLTNHVGQDITIWLK